MTEPIAIRREEGPNGGRWVAALDGHEAEMTFSRVSAQLIIVDHTGVPEALKGRGLGDALARRAIDDARAEGFKIEPLCPFLKAWMDKRPETDDVRRGRSGR